MLEESSTSYLGPGCREFESRHSDQKSKICLRRFWTFLFVWSETRKIKCGADEHRRRGLDRAEPLFSPHQEENANESRHSEHSYMELGLQGFHNESFIIVEICIYA